MQLIIRSVVMSVLILVASPLSAQKPRAIAAAPGEPQPAQIDSVADDLQKIVVLCATEPDSKEFEDSWRAYVQSQGVSEAGLGPLIFQVINDAEAYRGNRRLNRGERPNAAHGRRAAIYRDMHDTAMAVIRKSGG